MLSIEESRQILLDLVPNSFEPIGMRTISGELNNLGIGQSDFGQTGEFPRTTDPSFRDDGETTGDGSGNPTDDDGLTGPFGPPITNTDYSDPGNVVDSDPRIISNLTVDQSVNNPAAVAAAGASPGFDGVYGGPNPDDVLGEGVKLIDPDGVAGSGDESFFIPNVAPDEGLSAPFNSWMTLFGQFFSTTV